MKEEEEEKDPTASIGCSTSCSSSAAVLPLLHPHPQPSQPPRPSSSSCSCSSYVARKTVHPSPSLSKGCGCSGGYPSSPSASCGNRVHPLASKQLGDDGNDPRNIYDDNYAGSLEDDGTWRKSYLKETEAQHPLDIKRMRSSSSAASAAAAFTGADADNDIDEDEGSKLINNCDDCGCNHLFFRLQDDSLSCRYLLKGQKVRKLKDEEVRKSEVHNFVRAEEKEPGKEEMEEEKEGDKEKEETKKEEKDEEDADRENKANLTNSVDARHETINEALKLILDNNREQQEKPSLPNNAQRSDTKKRKKPEDKESGRNEAETSGARFPAEYSADDVIPKSASRFEDESEVWQRWVDSTHLMMLRHKRFSVSLEESAGVNVNLLKQTTSCPFLPINISISTEVKRPAHVEDKRPAHVEVKRHVHVQVKRPASVAIRRPAPVEPRHPTPTELRLPAPVELRHPAHMLPSNDRSSDYPSISSRRGPFSTRSTAGSMSDDVRIRNDAPNDRGCCSCDSIDLQLKPKREDGTFQNFFSCDQSSDFSGKKKKKKKKEKILALEKRRNGEESIWRSDISRSTDGRREENSPKKFSDREDLNFRSTEAAVVASARVTEVVTPSASADQPSGTKSFFRCSFLEVLNRTFVVLLLVLIVLYAIDHLFDLTGGSRGDEGNPFPSTGFKPSCHPFDVSCSAKA